MNQKQPQPPLQRVEEVGLGVQELASTVAAAAMETPTQEAAAEYENCLPGENESIGGRNGMPNQRHSRRNHLPLFD